MSETATTPEVKSRGLRKTRVGEVVSDKGNKTIVVKAITRVPHAKFGKIGDAWSQLVPELLDRHCCLESFYRGHLTVLVDSSPQLYDLKQLLLSGLQQQLLLACKSAGLRKITLKPGRWYDPTEEGFQKLRFD